MLVPLAEFVQLLVDLVGALDVTFGSNYTNLTKFASGTTDFPECLVLTYHLSPPPDPIRSDWPWKLCLTLLVLGLLLRPPLMVGCRGGGRGGCGLITRGGGCGGGLITRGGGGLTNKKPKAISWLAIRTATRKRRAFEGHIAFLYHSSCSRRALLRLPDKRLRLGFPLSPCLLFFCELQEKNCFL